jgi:hypothetical protein
MGTTAPRKHSRPLVLVEVDYIDTWKQFQICFLNEDGFLQRQLSLHESDLSQVIASLSAAAVFFRARVAGRRAHLKPERDAKRRKNS